MPAAPSPATTLHDVVVTNEQTRAEWRAGRAFIEHGRIVLPAKHPPPTLFARASTYTVVARDGAERLRRFSGVVFDEGASEEGKRYVFV
jgi:hypothetical protein